MMTPEAKASLLLLITQQQQPPRSNLSFPLSDVKLLAADDLCLRRDGLCVKSSMLQSGVMPKVNWSRVKTKPKFELACLLHRKIDACFDFVDSSRARQPAVVDIDHLLLKERADICILHNKCMVHVATFSPEVCSKTCSNAADAGNVSVELDKQSVEGIKAASEPRLA
jgi:hypothetical protein